MFGRNTGQPWKLTTEAGNSFYSVTLLYRDKTDLFFNRLVAPPARGSVCLQFRYRKYSLGALLGGDGCLYLNLYYVTAGRKSVLTVLAWPFRGKPSRVSVVCTLHCYLL